MRFIKINKTMLHELNLSEAYLYGLLAAKSDHKTGFFKNANRALLSTYVLGKNTKKSKETITGYLQNIAKTNAISVKHNWSESSDIFVVIPKSQYIEIYDNLFFDANLKDCSPKAKGLFIKMAAIAFKNSGKVEYGWKEIVEKTGISKNTYYKLLKELEEFNLIEDGQLNTKYFKTADVKVSRLEKVVNAYEEAFEEFDSNSRIYRQYVYVNSQIKKEANKKEILVFKRKNYDKIFANVFGKKLIAKRPIRIRL